MNKSFIIVLSIVCSFHSYAGQSSHFATSDCFKSYIQASDKKKTKTSFWTGLKVKAPYFIETDEDKVLDIVRNKKALNDFTQDFNLKRVGPQVGANLVEDIIQQGFVTGELCEKKSLFFFTSLHSYDDLFPYIEKGIKEMYPVYMNDSELEEKPMQNEDRPRSAPAVRNEF